MLARSELREQVLAHVRRIAQSPSSPLRFGLATFGDTLELLAPPGSSADTISERLAQAPISSTRVLLFRNIAQATELLAEHSSGRRGIALLATGHSDDQQLDHDQAARDARNRDTAIYTLSYPDLPAITGDGDEERLRLLARDTGGVAIVSNEVAGVPERVLSAPFAGLANGGALSVDLGPALNGLPAGEYLVRVSMDTTSGTVRADVPVFLASSARPSGNSLPIDVGAQVQAPQPAPPPPSAPLPSGSTSTTFWVLLAAALVLALVLALLVVLLFLRRRSAGRNRPRPATRSRLQGPSVPYLVNTDGDMSSHRVTGDRFKIGRLGNNDLVLGDPSVSRHHAELIQVGDGYRVADLESMNGVYVNGRRIRERRLADGDELEIGDVRMSFELRFDDPLEHDSTRELDSADPQASNSDTDRGRVAG